MDALLERLSIAFGVLAVGVILLPTARARALGGIGLSLLALAAAGDTVGGAGHGTTFAAVNELLAGLGAAIVVGAGAFALRARPAGGTVPRADSPDRPDPLLLLGMLIASVAPHLVVLGLGVLLTIASQLRKAIRSGPGRWWIPLVASALLLGIAFALMLTITGPEGGRVSRLPDGPFSPAAERWLVLLVGGGSLLVAGLPPLHRAPWRLSLAPLAAILLVRVVVPALSAGLEESQSLAMLVLVLGLAAAALAGRWSEVMVAGGLIALWSGQEFGQLAACALVLWGWFVGRGVQLRERWAGLLAAVPALGALPALESALLAQVVLPVTAVAAVVVGLGAEFRRRSRAVSQPL